MCSNCNQSYVSSQSGSCGSCNFRPSSLNSCIPCGPLQLETACGFFKLIDGFGIKSEVDYCSHQIKLSVVLTAVLGAPASTDGVDGEMRIDTTNSRLYVKVLGTWKYTSLT